MRRAGIKEFTFHDLRHTFASKLVMKGASLKAVQELLGHKDIKMTMRYAHLAEDIKKDAVKLLDGAEDEKYGQKMDTKKGQPMVRSANLLISVAGTTGLEPAISGLTGQCVNQLHHAPTGRISLQCPVFMVGGTGLEPATPCL